LSQLKPDEENTRFRIELEVQDVWFLFVGVESRLVGLPAAETMVWVGLVFAAHNGVDNDNVLFLEARIVVDKH
jgi:hypothetical protein